MNSGDRDTMHYAFLLLLSPLLTGPQTPETGLRMKMVHEQIEHRGVRNPDVLRAMRNTPRHAFVPDTEADRAYGDYPLPIGYGATISQPYIVAFMTELLDVKPTHRVLEIGTGSGYQAAVLAELTDEVYSIEIRENLAKQAARRLKELGYDKVRVKCGDGYLGWEEAAPFDAIIVTAAPNHIPPPLIKQLKEGGRMVLPLGSTGYFQTLTLITKKKGQTEVQHLESVSFVPMVGEAQK